MRQSQPFVDRAHPAIAGARVLVVDDDPGTCELLETMLKGLGYETVTAQSGPEALDALKDPFDVVLSDIRMGEMDGVELCEKIHAEWPGLPVVMITGFSSFETAVASLRAGAYDFLTKPVDREILAACVARAAKARQLDREIRRLKREVGGSTPIPGAVGASPAMKQVYDLVDRVAPTDASVLIHGETGTGKELVARAIHARGPRAHGPFVALNCAAVPALLLESELFGHARGAFTDAKASRDGLFVAANGGTIFLDEIGELPLELQVKLLRVLQDHRVRPLGSTHEVSFDARLITATHRDLETEVHEHRFREDLYYRINVVTIHVPPLRERGTDVLAIAQHILHQRGGPEAPSLSPSVAERLLSYEWPGNVRELENCIERALALARFDQLTVQDLPEKMHTHRAQQLVVDATSPTELVTIDELERRYIQRVLSLVGGNKTRAARILGLDRRTLYRKLEAPGEQAE
ncbi:MAG: sigma-54-dependent Fis family transcriptional regulator [Polyangiaceae bacterium]|nr:sigma-54-dependent Fis family transcriptional regulator [Polyangiaceae bacterium]